MGPSLPWTLSALITKPFSIGSSKPWCPAGVVRASPAARHTQQSSKEDRVQVGHAPRPLTQSPRGSWSAHEVCLNAFLMRTAGAPHTSLALSALLLSPPPSTPSTQSPPGLRPTLPGAIAAEPPPLHPGLWAGQGWTTLRRRYAVSMRAHLGNPAPPLHCDSDSNNRHRQQKQWSLTKCPQTNQPPTASVTQRRRPPCCPTRHQVCASVSAPPAALLWRLQVDCD